MAINREKKTQIIDRVASAAKNSNSMVFVNFHGLSVGDTTELRKKLTEEGIGYAVAKKTLIKRALADRKIEGQQPALEGEIALAYGSDLIAPAREIYGFQKKHKGGLAIVGGVFEGVYKNQEEMMEIASIPPLETLRGMFVNVINSPIQGLVVALDQVAQKKA